MLKTALAMVFAAFTLTGLVPHDASAEPRTYKLDPEHTLVAFIVDHLGFSRVLGRFNKVEGGFVYDKETQTLSDLKVVVQTASMDTGHEERDGHLRSEDFLDAEQHPEMVFRADAGTPAGPKSGTVTGSLSLRGEAHPLTLDVTLNKAGTYPFGHEKPTLGISARGAMQRSEWGMTYGVADALVGDTVDLIIEIEAIQQD